jgi:TrmH family RNA methyltransferase
MSLSKNEIKLVKSLQIKKYREAHSLFVVEGIKLVEELINQAQFDIKKIFFTATNTLQLPTNIDLQEVTENELARMSGLKQPNKLLALVHTRTPETMTLKDQLILMLDEVKDPGNLGTILRTADWFGISTIIASENSVDQYNPKVVQSSMGAIFRTHFYRSDLANTLQSLKQKDYKILGADLAGEKLTNFAASSKLVLVMGSESHGLSQEIEKLIDTKITIPRIGTTESLNVAMATGIILSHLCLKG